MNKYCIVLTTFANETDATKVINAVLENKLAACAQVININSHYTWKGKVCHEPEVLILFKTQWNLYDLLESKIKEMHPYEIPERIVNAGPELLAFATFLTGFFSSLVK